MNKIILCGHTGSQNRGCEAIMRSTEKIIHMIDPNIEILGMTFDKGYDVKIGLDKILKLISYPKKNIMDKAFSFFAKKVLKNPEYANGFYYKDLDNILDHHSVAMNVGGDTYCYGTPYLSYALNNILKKKNVPNIFWGCSVEDNAYQDKRMKEDIDKYKFIFVRESISCDHIRKCVNDSSKIYMTCDPAFHLNMKATELPDGFVENNTVGINLSPLVFKDCHDENDSMYSNVKRFIDYILENTDMNVCLIPHVYNIADNTQDIYVLNKIRHMCESDRISIVDKELSCEELKYIISKCRFFVGARTHATIAAYSTGVPTIVISYSVKSRGIARDLFGDEKGYAVSWKSLINKDDLASLFEEVLLKNEAKIRERYTQILPEYTESIVVSLKDALKRLEVINEK